jgi:hypothetical protein
MRGVARAILATVACLVAWGGGAVPAQAKQVYRSPNYHWNHKLPKVAPVIPG